MRHRLLDVGLNSTACKIAVHQVSRFLRDCDGDFLTQVKFSGEFLAPKTAHPPNLCDLWVQSKIATDCDSSCDSSRKKAPPLWFGWRRGCGAVCNRTLRRFQIAILGLSVKDAGLTPRNWAVRKTDTDAWGRPISPGVARASSCVCTG